MENEQLCASYMKRDDKFFFISTANRESSAAAHPGKYAETLVWECDKDWKRRGGPIFSEIAPASSLHGHNAVCALIHATGGPKTSDSGL